jgi:nitrogen regulatory protein P-II 1
MKRIEAIIRPSRLDQVREAVADAGIKGMTISEERGPAGDGGRSVVYDGSVYVVDFVPEVRVVMVAADDLASSILELVERVAKTGTVSVSDVREVVSIRTGHHGEEAL